MVEEQGLEHEYVCLTELVYEAWWLGGFLRYVFSLPDARAL